MKNIDKKMLKVHRKTNEPKHDWEKWGLTENHTKADIFQYGKKNK